MGARLSEPQPVLELLKQHDGLIILGDPGAGKTTFLKYLALRLAGELGIRRRCREFGAGVDEVGNRLRLGQVEATIEECAAGELAGFGVACARAEDGMEHLAGDQASAMAPDFHRVLPRETPRPAEHREQDFVHDGVPMPDVAVVDGVGGDL